MDIDPTRPVAFKDFPELGSGQRAALSSTRGPTIAIRPGQLSQRGQLRPALPEEGI
jgi:hypothetical protein